MKQMTTWQNILLPESDNLYELYHENSKQHQFNIDSFSAEEIKTFIKKKHTSLPYAYDKLISLPQPNHQHDKIEINEKDNIPSNCMSVSFISELLYESYGKITLPSSQQFERPLYSVHNIFPLEIYICTKAINNLQNGLWHYNVDIHALEYIKSTHTFNLEKQQSDYVLGKEYIAVFITGILHDLVKIQGEKAYRNILLEAGKVLQNIFLLSKKNQVSHQELINYNDFEFEKFLEIDSIDNLLFAISILSVNTLLST